MGKRYSKKLILSEVPKPASQSLDDFLDDLDMRRLEAQGHSFGTLRDAMADDRAVRGWVDKRTPLARVRQYFDNEV